MRALRLDYRDNRRTLIISGWVMLAFSLCLGIGLVWHVVKLNHDLDRQQLKIDKIEGKVKREAPLATTSPMDPQQLAEAIKYSNVVIRQLNLPWDVLFVQLEKTDGKHVAMLGLEPDSHRSVLKIAAEARDYQGMLQFLRDIKNGGGLSEVYLLDHKLDETNPDRPVHFTLEAKWITKP